MDLLSTCKRDYFVCHPCQSSGTNCLSLHFRAWMTCHLTVICSPQPPRTGTTGAGRTSCCAQTAASISRSTASCPPSRSQWTHRHLCSNLSKRKRMDSAGSIAWGPDGTEARYEHTDFLPSHLLMSAVPICVSSMLYVLATPNHCSQYMAADVNAT